jgi:hypothetical protein
MNKNLDKLKQFFRSNKTNSAQERVYVLNNEIERELDKKMTVEKRVKLLRDLSPIVETNRLEEVRKLNDLAAELTPLPSPSSQSKNCGR